MPTSHAFWIVNTGAIRAGNEFTAVRAWLYVERRQSTVLDGCVVLLNAHLPKPRAERL